MVSKIKTIFSEMKGYSEEFIALSKQYNISCFWFKIDCLICRFLHGALPEQYFCFKMYKLNFFERKQYITTKRSIKIERYFNTKVDPAIGSKHLFNLKYSKFVKRNWIYVPYCDFNEITDFLKNNKVIIKKPTNSRQGISVEKIISEDVLNGDLQVFIDDCRQRKCVLESFIVQHSALSQLNPSSVNTIRIATVCDGNNNVHILGASLRVGAPNSVVDNFHSGGVQYALDVDNGFVLSSGTSSNGNVDIMFHPYSNIKMIGFQIPNWDIIIKNVKEAATISRTLRYIGWDVAVLENGCEIVEANSGQGCNGLQLDGIGKYSIVKKFMK